MLSSGDFEKPSRLVPWLGRARPQPSGNMTVVQALRGFAACWVVLFHVAEGRHIDSLLTILPGAITGPLFFAGHYGVAIFFGLSGFVIAHSLRGAEIDGRYFGRFLLRRSIRLDPPYWGAILICICLAIVSAKVKNEAYQPPTMGTLIAHVLYLQAIIGVPEINSVFWTLTYEIQFYVFFCFSLFTANILKHRGMAVSQTVALLLMFVIALASSVGFTPSLLPGLFVNLWQAFFVGVLAYVGLTKPIVRLLFVILVAAMILPISLHDHMFNAISACTACLLFACGMTGALYRGLRWRWLQSLGLISYSLYLLHNPIGGATGFVIRKFIGNSPFANVGSLFAILVVTIGFAGAYFFLIERPAHALSRRIGRRPL